LHAAAASATARLAVDIGGTFTDIALEWPHAGIIERHTAKVLTTPSAPEQGVMTGIARCLAETGLAPARIGIIVHGTTLATNALIERKGAVTALVTTEGFRDVLALGNESRYDQYDLNIVLPEPLVPRWLRLPVTERLDAGGRVLKPLDEDMVRALLPVLEREGVQSLAIGFLHAFVNPDHERRARDIIAAARPDLPISISSDISPEMREWERFSTTVANAYVQPLMASYLRRLEAGLREAGFDCPLFLMLSGGGLTTVETACRCPIRLVESGPAGGAIFAAHVARQCGLDRVLSYDMGGTTAKVCMIDGFTPQTSRAFEVARVGRFKKGSGLPLRIPVIEMVEIGAGGGSIAHVDPMGRIAVGPESAGADPGPACYGRGGTEPTVTDSNLLLGRYDPEKFAGGRLSLDPAAAATALAARIGEPLGLPPDMAALGVVEMVDENMANAARVHAVESGKGFEDRTLIAFGGGGPVHGLRVAEKCGIRRIVVPTGAGVGSAIGFLRAPTAYEVVRSLYQRFAAFDLAAVNALLDAMLAEARAVVAQGAAGRPTVESRIGYMRYVGQGHEIPVAIPARTLVAGDVAAIRAEYDAAYARYYDRPVPGSDVEILSFAVVVSTEHEPVPRAPSVEPVPGARPVGHQQIRDTATGLVASVPVYDRAGLPRGATVEGACLIAEDETSTLVGAGWTARIDGLGFIVMEKAR
jgi:N-methylhydantoinase A